MNTLVQEPVRLASVSFTCHLAGVKSYFAHRRNCDGKSYTPSITDKGVPCTCTCHTTGWDKA